METVKAIRLLDLHSRSTTPASLLPLWLLSFAITAEGFPRPPISIELAATLFVLAVVLAVVLLWKRWMTIELLLYSLLPCHLLFAFDEISTAYKTPFIILCAILLTAGVVVSHWSRSTRLGRGLILLAVAVVTIAMASHAASNFWDMASGLGYAQCFPDAHGCAALTGQETPWWVLFFGCNYSAGTSLRGATLDVTHAGNSVSARSNRNPWR